MALQDPQEVPALDAQDGRRLHRLGGRRARKLIEQRHLSDDLAGSERCELRLFAVAVLRDVDLAGADDERADAGIALTHDLLSRLVRLLDGGPLDRIERSVVEILEP